MTSTYTITTLLPCSSSETYIGEQGKPPVITPGKLMPDLLFNFENGAYSYFSFKEIKPKKEIAKVAGGLQDGCVQMWYRLNRTAINAVGFTAFMKSVCENWLDLGWEQEVKLLIVSSSQGSKPITDWIMLVESTNALLLGHACALSMNDLHNHIQSHIHPDTMTAATTAKLHLVTNYEKYKCMLKVINDACVRADRLLKAAIHQMMTTSLTASNSTSNCSQVPHTSTNFAGTSTVPANRPTSCSADHCPPLTMGERALLTEHGGCFHCQCFYCDHIAPACTNGFPDKLSYKTLMEADALAAKK